jgi:hypothetical protein
VIIPSYGDLSIIDLGATRVGIPPQVNVMGTLIFVAGILIAAGNAVIARRRA